MQQLLVAVYCEAYMWARLSEYNHRLNRISSLAKYEGLGAHSRTRSQVVMEIARSASRTFYVPIKIKREVARYIKSTEMCDHASFVDYALVVNGRVRCCGNCYSDDELRNALVAKQVKNDMLTSR